MFCPKCGSENDNAAVQCSNCGQALNEQPAVVQVGAPAAPGGATSTAPSIPNYLVQSILATLCCCLPFGIVAIIFASQVNTKLATGDIAGAMDSSKKAKMWCWVSLACWLVGVVIYAAIMLVSILAGTSHGM